ncbi:hypothetical protein GCM10009735_86170 [Actinomadura chokoriensis]
MKNSREIMEILKAYDLTGSYRAAAELAGCDHHTAAHYVKMRAAGQGPEDRRHRARPIDAFLPKIEELLVGSNGKIRAKVVHKRIVAMGFTGGNAPPAAPSQRPRPSSRPVSGGSIGPGSPRRACGCSETGAPAR